MKDHGRLILDTAAAMSPEALAEMLALGQMTTATGNGSPQFTNPRGVAPLDWLIARKLITVKPTGWRSWEISISRLGWLVLLARVERDLRAVGRLPAEKERADD